MIDLYFIDTGFIQLLIAFITLIFVLGLLFLGKEILAIKNIWEGDFEQLKDNYQQFYEQSQSQVFSTQERYNVLLHNLEDGIIKNELQQQYRNAQQPNMKQMKEEKTFFSAGVLVKYARHTMLWLGILGVVYGFAQMDLNNNKLTMPPLPDTFAALFWASLGVTVFTLCQLGKKWYHQRLVSSVSNYMNTYIAPQFAPVSDEQHLVTLVNAVSQNTQALNGVVYHLQRTANHLADDYEHIHQLTQNLKASIGIYTEGQEMLHQDIQMLTQSLLNTRQKAEQGNSDNYKLLEAMSIHLTAIDKVNNKLTETEFAVGDWLKEIVAVAKDQQDDFNKQLKTILTTIRSNQSTIQSTVNRFRLTIDKFAKTLDGIEDDFSPLTTVLSSSSEQQINKLNQLSVQLVDLHQILLNLQQQLPNLLSETAQQINQNGGGGAANTQLIEQRAQQIAQQRVTEQLQKYQEQQQANQQNNRAKEGDSFFEKTLKKMLKDRET